MLDTHAIRRHEKLFAMAVPINILTRSILLLPYRISVSGHARFIRLVDREDRVIQAWQMILGAPIVQLVDASSASA